MRSIVAAHHPRPRQCGDASTDKNKFFEEADAHSDLRWCRRGQRCNNVRPHSGPSSHVESRERYATEPHVDAVAEESSCTIATEAHVLVALQELDVFFLPGAPSHSVLLSIPFVGDGPEGFVQPSAQVHAHFGDAGRLRRCNGGLALKQRNGVKTIMLNLECPKKHAGVQRRARDTARSCTPLTGLQRCINSSNRHRDLITILHPDGQPVCLQGLSFELVKVGGFHGHVELAVLLPRLMFNPSRNLFCHCTPSLQTHRPCGRLKTPQCSTVMTFPKTQSWACQRINPCPTITNIGMFSCSANWLASTFANRSNQENGPRRAAYPEALLVLPIFFLFRFRDTSWHPSPSTPPWELPSPSTTLSGKKNKAKSYPQWLHNGCWIVLLGAQDTHK